MIGMKSCEIIRRELDSKGYSLLRFPFKCDESEIGEFSDLANNLISVIKSDVDYLKSSSIPRIISEDKEFTEIPGFYLVESNHINYDVYMMRNGNWFKVLIK